MISFKQRKYPVLLLAGVSPSDPISILLDRLQAVTPAMQFCEVAGFVFHSPNIVDFPSIALNCKNQGFKVMSWGSGNLSPEGIAEQVRAGVTGFVTDDIAATKRFLRLQAFSLRRLFQSV
jgi:glycerophosphoryl diester phosphodiesterase